MIVYEGCDENPEFLSHPDFYFLNPNAGNGRSNSDGELDRDDDHRSYNPDRFSRESQILKRQKVTGLQQQKLDFDSLSITDTSSEYYLTDSCETQSFSTSPQSVDSGLECYMMDQSSSSSSTSDYSSWTSVSGHQAGIHFKRLLRHSAPARTNLMGYECADNSADSTDSGLFAPAGAHPQGKKTTMLKRSATISYTDSEEDSESDMTWQHHLDVQQLHCIQPTELSGSPGDDEGELTPVLEVSRTDEFTDAADGSQTQKKRRVMDEDKEEVLDAASKSDNCWSDCVDVRMIDFAHTTFSGYLGLDERVHWGPDNGYLLGLENLTEILKGLRGCSSYAHQKNTLCLSS